MGLAHVKRHRRPVWLHTGGGAIGGVNKGRAHRGWD